MDDTFHLDKESALFSQVAADEIPALRVDVDPQHDAAQPDTCQVVEIKEREIVKNHPVEVYPSSTCHQSAQSVEMVEIIEDTEESDTEILTIKPVKIVERPVVESTERPLRLEITDRLNRTEETTVTAWRSQEKRQAVRLKKEVEMSKTYELICQDQSSRSRKEDPRKGRRRLQRSLAMDHPLPPPPPSPPPESDRESFYGSDKETDDIPVFSDDERMDDDNDESDTDSWSSDDQVSTVIRRANKVGRMV